MRRTLALLLAAVAALPAMAQQVPLGSSEKVFLPGSIGEAGGKFQLEEINTSLIVKPYAESFEARATLRVTGTKGAVRYAAFIFNGGRRCTDVTEGGQRLTFTHVGDFVVVKMNPPLVQGSQRLLTMRYTGKAHCVSSQWIRDYKIDKYGIALRVLPLTGNLTATTSLTLIGTGDSLPIRPHPSLPPTAKAPPHWIPPILSDTRIPKLGLVLNNNYAIDKVSMNSQDAPYTHSKGVLEVPLNTAIAKGQQIPVLIAYSGKVRNTERNRIWDNFDADPVPRNPLGAE